jgi:hypothetical protein
MSSDQTKSASEASKNANGQFDFGSAKKVNEGDAKVMPVLNKTAKRMQSNYDPVEMRAISNSKDDGATYYDKNGNKGTMKQYNNESYFQDDSTQFDFDVAGAINDKLENGGRVEFTQKESEFISSMGGDGRGGEVNMNTSSIAGMTNAAMVTSLGEEVADSPGTYKVGNNTFVTGMDKSTAQGILATQGISDVRSESGQVVFGQRGVQKRPNPLLAETSHAGGKVIGRYNMGIGTKKANAPKSFESDGNKGGTLTFANQQSAAQYMMSNGNVGMAERILSAGKGKTEVSDIHSFNNTKSGFSISFNGKNLQAQGMSMGLSQDGTNMFVASQDRNVKNPFEINRNDPEVSNEDENVSTLGHRSNVRVLDNVEDTILQPMELTNGDNYDTSSLYENELSGPNYDYLPSGSNNYLTDYNDNDPVVWNSDDFDDLGNNN